MVPQRKRETNGQPPTFGLQLRLRLRLKLSMIKIGSHTLVLVYILVDNKNDRDFIAEFFKNGTSDRSGISPLQTKM